MNFRAFALAVAVLSAFGARAQEAAPAFPLSEVPASLENFQERTDYFVTHFWDRCNFGNAFSRRQAMADALASFLQFLPTASRTASHAGLDRLFEGLKQSPEGLAFMVEQAEGQLYSDSARFTSDEVFLRFLEAGMAGKKVDRDKRERYRKLHSRISASMLGSRAPDVALKLRDGSQSSLGAVIDSDTTSITVVWLFDPELSQTSLDRTRLDADTRLRSFLRSGALKFAAIYPGAPTPAFEAEAARMPEEWTVAASPEADMKMDMMVYPSFYILGNNGNILRKNLYIDNLLDIFYNL